MYTILTDDIVYGFDTIEKIQEFALKRNIYGGIHTQQDGKYVIALDKKYILESLSFEKHTDALIYLNSNKDAFPNSISYDVYEVNMT